MQVGDRFNSYKVFQDALTVYKRNTNNEFWLRDSRTIENQRRRNPNTVENMNESLKYYYVRLACIKGGRPFKTKNGKTNRKCSTYKQDCPASIFLKVSTCKQFLTIQEIRADHNHTASKSYFNSLAKQRLNLPNNLKVKAQEALKSGANKKIILDQLTRETGRKLTLKDLTNLSNRSRDEKMSLEECIRNLKDVHYCNDVEVLVDKNEMFRGLYFQDDRMKKYMNAFPEIIFVDGTYCLVDLRFATYIIMVEDGNGLSEIVAVCLLAQENEESIYFFIETFKNRNSAWEKIQVVMSDKDKTERSVFLKSFPQAKLMICLFHTFQIFNREVSNRKMGISSEEVQMSKYYLQKLAYASSEKNYNDIYSEMIEKVPERVKQYYDLNWGNITNQWVQYLTLQNLCMSNKTNNRLESINSKLKSVITRYSPLQDFVKHLFIIINSLRAGKDVKNSQMINRSLIKPYKDDSAENLYCQYLTTFAFEKVERQFKRVESELRELSTGNYLAVSTEGLLQITPLDCECLFRKSTGLPCGHIFKCRSLMSLPLFDENLCLARWTKSYSEKILNECEMAHPADSDNNHGIPYTEEENYCSTTVLGLKKSKPKYLSNHEKFNIINDEGKKMAQLCSEVSTDLFYKRLNIIRTIRTKWSDQQDETIVKLFNSLSNDGTNSEFEDSPDVREITGQAINDSDHNSIIENIEEFLVCEDGKLLAVSSSSNNNYSETGRPLLLLSPTKSSLCISENNNKVDIILHENPDEKDISRHIHTDTGSEINVLNSVLTENINNVDIPLPELHETSDEIMVSRNIHTDTESKSNALKLNLSCKLEDKGNKQNEDHISNLEVNKIGSEETKSRIEPIAIHFQDIKMPHKIKKRGRPKGLGNTVIGLKRKKFKNRMSK